jgi:hypothetical protein
VWSCGNTDNNVERRSLSEDDHQEYHDHSHREHSDHEFDASSIDNTIADLKHSLRGSDRGSDLRVGKRRRVQGASYAYWVDVYVEIDHALCNRNGETCASGIGPKTLNYGELTFQPYHLVYFFARYRPLSLSFLTYIFSISSMDSVNALFTGANTIYEVSFEHLVFNCAITLL